MKMYLWLVGCLLFVGNVYADVETDAKNAMDSARTSKSVTGTTFQAAYDALGDLSYYGNYVSTQVDNLYSTSSITKEEHDWAKGLIAWADSETSNGYSAFGVANLWWDDTIPEGGNGLPLYWYTHTPYSTDLVYAFNQMSDNLGQAFYYDVLDWFTAYGCAQNNVIDAIDSVESHGTDAHNTLIEVATYFGLWVD